MKGSRSFSGKYQSSRVNRANDCLEKCRTEDIQLIKLYAPWLWQLVTLEGVDPATIHSSREEVLGYHLRALETKRRELAAAIGQGEECRGAYSRVVREILQLSFPARELVSA